jgi:hypothetical protein
MAFRVKLTKNHQRVLLEALATSQEIKQKKLRNPESKSRMNEEYYAAALRILNETEGVECGRTGVKPGDNIFAWICDQLYHSGDMTETEFGKLSLNICEAAGNNSYEAYCRDTIMKRFFE